MRDGAAVEAAFAAIARFGGADVVRLLTARYDFTGAPRPDHRRTSVDGLRHVLDAGRRLRPRPFAFANSLAARGFPPPVRS